MNIATSLPDVLACFIPTPVMDAAICCSTNGPRDLILIGSLDARAISMAVGEIAVAFPSFQRPLRRTLESCVPRSDGRVIRNSNFLSLAARVESIVIAVDSCRQAHVVDESSSFELSSCRVPRDDGASLSFPLPSTTSGRHCMPTRWFCMTLHYWTYSTTTAGNTTCSQEKLAWEYKASAANVPVHTVVPYRPDLLSIASASHCVSRPNLSPRITRAVTFSMLSLTSQDLRLEN
jgi:hypothetical protein